MYLDHCAVQAHRLDPDTHNLSMLQFFKQAIEHATFRPAVHTCIDGVPIAKALRQPTPLTAMLGYVQDRVEHAQICVIDVTALLGQAVFNLGVLLLANFHALRLRRLRHENYARK
jgi:hypothetical protein